MNDLKVKEVKKKEKMGIPVEDGLTSFFSWKKNFIISHHLFQIELLTFYFLRNLCFRSPCALTKIA